jgi:hypothetical protein
MISLRYLTVLSLLRRQSFIAIVIGAGLSAGEAVENVEEDGNC